MWERPRDTVRTADSTWFRSLLSKVFLLDSSDTPTVTAVCGYRLADKISQDSTMLHSDTFIVLNQQDQFGESPLPFPSAVCYGPHRTNHVVLVSSLVVFSSQHFVNRFGKVRFPITVSLWATIVGYTRCTISIITLIFLLFL